MWEWIGAHAGDIAGVGLAVVGGLIGGGAFAKNKLLDTIVKILYKEAQEALDKEKSKEAKVRLKKALNPKTSERLDKVVQ